MTKREIFIEGHRIARAIKNLFNTYRGAFSVALKRVYAELKMKVMASAPVEVEKQEVKAVAVTFETGESERVADGTKMPYGEANEKINEIYNDIKHAGCCIKEFIIVHFSDGNSYSFKFEVCNTQSSIKEAFDNRIEWYNSESNNIPEFEKQNQEYWKNFNYKY